MRSGQHEPAGALPPGFSRGGAAAYDKSALLAEYAALQGCRTLVETGLYEGQGSGMKLAGRLRYIALDWQEENVRRAREEGHEAYLGDSAALLVQLLVRPEALLTDPLEPPCLFWLDAHALDASEGSPQVCPLLGELAAVVGWEHAARSVVLIDDLWGMGTLAGWPTLDELRERVDAAGLWERDETGGIMRLVPKP